MMTPTLSPRMNDAGEVEMMTEEMIDSDPRSRRRLREMKISEISEKKNELGRFSLIFGGGSLRFLTLEDGVGFTLPQVSSSKIWFKPAVW
ncbi:hypothetical protein F2Q70_00035394 [Brassica cretica]|uniref:Uncharacterized protein n=1 Tax=Brassica cretica TaxID=69181 RepID=A0A8S9JUU9_BRACR|nr:hypothetical protein F2Q70_00035394 [Brassica cretica]